MATVATHISLDDIANAAADHDPNYETPILRLLSTSKAKGYDTVCISLTNEKWRERWKGMCLSPEDEAEKDDSAERLSEAWRSNPVFLREEVNVTRLDEAENTIVMLSDWLELDSQDEWVRCDAETALMQELAYASYLNVSVAILPPPRNRTHVPSYARAIRACLDKIPYMYLSVRVPVYDPSVFQQFTPTPRPCSPSPSISSSSIASSGSTTSSKSGTFPLTTEEEFNSTWEMWDVIRSVCESNPRLSLTLDLSPPLPLAPRVLEKWLAEPTRQIFLPASTFIANSKSYPVLPKGTQSFIRDIMKLQPTVILSGTNTGQHSRGGEKAYSQYIRHLEKTSPGVQAMKKSGTVENFSIGYQDYLQAPLQPLADNLQSTTYQTFEQDPIKYANYEEATFRALLEWPKANDRILLCVAGAGRGPLVARALKAISRAKRKAFIHVVEKNPNAFVTLQERQKTEWKDQVQLHFGDMRALELPEKVDILITELLGSFGDNELSPECLDGAARFLKPNGISIPSSYTAHIAPLSSTKLFNEVRGHEDLKKSETPYVVMFNAVNVLSGEGGDGHAGPRTQECWEFVHPVKNIVLNERGLPVTNSHNSRFAILNFHIPHAGVLHGLAGYFEAVLYGNVGLSIHPQRKDYISKDMISWFPIYFPFKDPLYLPGNSELHVSMWRLTDQQRVWYEWYAEAFLPVMMPVLDWSGNRASTCLTAVSTPLVTPSPTIDALDVPPIVNKTEIPRTPNESSRTETRLVKIGQTALHNPGGRSSWINL